MARLSFAIWVLAAGVVTRPSSAQAQIVNVQSLLASGDEHGLSGTISGSADWRTGNTDLLLLSAAPVVRYQAGAHVLLGVGRGEIGRSAGEQIIAKSFEHARYRYLFHPRALGELFAQHEYDQFRRIQLRALAGAGPRLSLVEGEKSELAWGVAYMLEWQRLRGSEPGDAAEEDLAHRISTYLTGRYALDDRVALALTTYGQPRIGAVRDVNLLAEVGLVMTLGHRLSFSTSFMVAYDSRPPARVHALDTALKSTLTYAF